MNSILRTALIIIFVVCLSGIYVSSALWASGGGCCGGGNSDKESGKNVEVVKDPVCGMEINDLKKSLSAVYKEKDYYFCSEYCKKTFKNDPASYTSTAAHQHGEGGGHMR
jgi:YHS domain-containing protein